MDPVCFYIGSRPIYWYGVFVALGFLAAVTHWTFIARREKRPEGFGSELGFWVMLSGILGARVAYILANLDYFRDAPLEILRIDRGGLIYYGGFIGAALGIILFARLRKLPLLSIADLAVSALPLGHALGRLGCFMNGCCYGLATTCRWAIFNADDYRYPVQLIEAALNIGVYLLLLRIYRRRKTNGMVLATYLMTYPVGRFLLEYLRGDQRMRWSGLDIAQEVSVVLFITGVILWLVLRRRKAPNP
ncbi:MAG TPA: prolipoprotein diacylglyceryl transferase [Kiritimatiellia bacterium]|nr:prolipoprotein diacylglyceryl transferase [Kiritimatiellia bacterium]